MSFLHSSIRVHNYYKNHIARFLFRRQFDIRAEQPLISFTFDDFPRTALFAGGEILRRYGACGTFYVSLGLLGKDSPSGPICSVDDLKVVVEQNHELGCHTFSHCHSWDTERALFEASILENRAALKRVFVNVDFESLSYPISEPRPLTKRDAARHFLCCRAGGQTLNAGRVDLNQLSAYFLEQSCGQIQPIKDLINLNRQKRGWIIFATHDVSAKPSRFGCTSAFFEEVLQYAVASGAQILPVAKALRAIGVCGR